MTVMFDEIFEQPDIVARLGADLGPVRAAVAGARASGARFVIYAARGTSDNAAVYGKYLATILARLPAGLAVPSAATLYDAGTDLRECLVIGISQSGATPDVAEYLAEARRAGAFTVAVTNDDDGVLAREAHDVLATRAGAERAVAATKTYTSQLAALALFWTTWIGDDDLVASLAEEVPAAMQEALALDPQVRELATWLRFSERLLVVARGFNFATALETALKLKETAYIAAMPYSAADLMHGPIAVVEHGYPALLYSLPGKALEGMRAAEAELRSRGAEVVVVEAPAAGSEPHTATGASSSPASGPPRRLLLPRGVPEPVSPLVAIVPGQLLACHLSLARGLDPDRPRGLSKVTRTH
jgi:glucosamine--fructose-6-phosphate aminotransferase (isomerizing)